MPATAPLLNDFVSSAQLGALIQLAQQEDLGQDDLDVTSQSLLNADQQAKASLVSRQRGRLCGVAMLHDIAAAYDNKLVVDVIGDDGVDVEPGEAVAKITGPLVSLLAWERVALNLCCHLSGIATLTAAYVAKTAGTKAKICDTRKTLPGLRGLQKYAVACGGGTRHRDGLYDAVLIKDNHIAHLPLESLAQAISEAVQRARTLQPCLKFIEVEVDRLDQLEAVLQAPIDIALLDNMPPDTLRQGVAMRDRLAPGVELEASGGVTLETVAAIAATGVDRISVGAITHAAPALDLGLDIA